MFVRSLSLRDFRSWEHAAVDLAPGQTVFVGANGNGKTNILESLGYLSTLSSHRVANDAPLIRSGAAQAQIGAAVVNAGRELRLDVELNQGAANRARINRSPVRRPREILGVLRTVLFAPEDLALVRGDPGERRRFLDELSTSRRPALAAVRADYDRVLRQRSALLKSAGRRRVDAELATLGTWDGHLAAHGAQLIAARIELVAALAPLLTQVYAQVAPGSRSATMEYLTSLAGSLDPDFTRPDRPGELTDVGVLEAAFAAELARARPRELERGVCLVGPHRDELELSLGTGPAKGFASHGESWSFALALRLAAFELLRAEGSDPVLLLDDVFAELDSRRRSALAGVAAAAEQVLVTAAVEDDIPSELRGSRIQVTAQDDGGLRRSVFA